MDVLKSYQNFMAVDYGQKGATVIAGVFLTLIIIYILKHKVRKKLNMTLPFVLLLFAVMSYFWGADYINTIKAYATLHQIEEINDAVIVEHLNYYLSEESQIDVNVSIPKGEGFWKQIHRLNMQHIGEIKDFCIGIKETTKEELEMDPEYVITDTNSVPDAPK